MPSLSPQPAAHFQTNSDDEDDEVESSDDGNLSEGNDPGSEEGLGEGMDPEGFAGPAPKIVKPLTPEALAAFKAAQDRAGIIYISRIPPGMRPAKVRHLMSAYGEVGRVYLQQEDPKRAYLRKKYTSTKKPHFTEGWVEFKDKKIARSVAAMLNAQPIGGKKGTRWRDDVWTMKYLPKFKWNMLTEQVAHEAQMHQAKLRIELTQSRAEQQEYLRNVELAKVLEKRAAKKKEKGEEFQFKKRPTRDDSDDTANRKKKRKTAAAVKDDDDDGNGPPPLDSVLSSIF